MLAYTVISFLAIRGNSDVTEAMPVILVFKSLLVLILIVGNFIGGNLVLKEKVLEGKHHKN